MTVASSRPRVAVVVPTYNERESIVPCLRGLAAALEGVDHEILVCHDTDEDTTLPAIAEMPDRPASVRLVKNTLGRGALQAIRAGFAAATGDVVVTTMADLSDPPAFGIGHHCQVQKSQRVAHNPPGRVDVACMVLQQLW